MSEYIVNEAALKCDNGEYETKLSIPSARICIAGKTAAHSQDCVPNVNIYPFGRCASGTYQCSRKAKPGKEHPCVLDLIEHYYLTDENMIVTDSMEIMGPLENCVYMIRKMISDIVTGMTHIQHLLYKKMNYQFCNEISKQYGIIWKKTGDVYQLCESVEEVVQAVTIFSELSIQNCNYLEAGNEDPNITGHLNNILISIGSLKEQVIFLSSLPKMQKKNLITTESFLVCKCGGILTFESSGQ